MDKKLLRQNILSQRDGLSIQEREQNSRKIMARLIKHPVFIESSSVMVYASFRSEVMTEELIKYCLSQKEKVIVPVINKKRNHLVLSEIKRYDDLVPSTFGINEPQNLCFVEPRDVELFILPGAAFDEGGNRLVYGGGYFDRLLSTKLECQKLIGLAFELQVKKGLPCKNHDISMDCVITEKKVRYCTFFQMAYKPEGGEED